MNSYYLVVYFVWIWTLKGMTCNKQLELNDTSISDIENGGHRRFNVLGGISLSGDGRKKIAMLHLLDQIETNSICSPLAVLYMIIQFYSNFADEGLAEFYYIITGVPWMERQRGLNRLTGIYRSLLGPTGLYMGLFVSEAYNMLPTFNSGEAYLRRIDFKDKVGTARKINTWAKAKTNNAIKKVISRSRVIDASGIIVSIAYFSADWKYSFRLAGRGEFFTPRGRKIQPMMNIRHTFRYLEHNTNHVQLIEIPFTNNANFLIILPSKKVPLKNTLEMLKKHPSLLVELYRRMYVKYVDIHMPTFKIETEFNLDPTLRKIGFSASFNQGFSLSIFNRSARGFQSPQTIQKCVIDVNEGGISGLFNFNITGRFSRSMPPKIYINRPFLFYVIYEREQLLAGIYNGDIDDEMKIDTNEQYEKSSEEIELHDADDIINENNTKLVKKK